VTPFWPSGAAQLPHSLVSGAAAPLSFLVDAMPCKIKADRNFWRKQIREFLTFPLRRS
jgi:hypothetical protein